MRIRTLTLILFGNGLIALLAFPETPDAGSRDASRDNKVLRNATAEIAKIAKIEGPSAEQTCKQRNEALNRVFQQYTQDLKSEVTGETIRSFQGLVREGGLSSFDDFRDAMLVPLRYVKDPASGKRVPVFGPLGSDIINPWLAAMGVAEGKPLNEQPMYKLASDVLREHIDFAIIGTRDHNLSMELLPLELRENAHWAYRRLNPTNMFDGGFDQPLFYITIREAAKKLFREDHPAAKLTMADLVVSRDEGGFGIRSCLLCHNHDHEELYARLVGQSLFYQTKADAANNTDAVPPDGLAVPEDSLPAKQAKATAAMFQLAANRVLERHRKQIDPAAVHALLGTLSTANVNRLKPGFDEFYEILDNIGCTMCHSTSADPAPEVNPAKFGAFMLKPNNYFKTKNVLALASLIDLDDVSQSKLLAKAAGKMKHRGKNDLKLEDAELQQLRRAIHEWVHSLDVERSGQSANHP